jgi:uncharacterized damage-inducible protein DinB
MLRKIDDFLKIWEYESEATIKIFKCITDEALNKNIPGYERTLGLLAWHITVSAGEMGERTGLKVDCPKYDSLPPVKISDIIDTYKKAADSLLNEIKNKWTDESLLVESDMYGEMWQNGRTLASIISHQSHHRAQMTVLMRILGLPVIGVYGPAKEEWVTFGMEPQK